MRVQRKYIVWLAIVATVAVVAWFLWAELAAPTRIALVDFQAFQKASIVKANDDKFVEYEEVTADKFGKLTKFDFVLGFGMGMRITAEQRAQIQSAADKGIPLYIYAATNPDNNITNLDSITQREVKAYLDNGNKLNYKNLARYIRKNIDRKRFFITPPDSMQETPADVLYHLSENTVFKKVDDYEVYLKQNGFYRENAPKIAIIGGLNDPFSGNRDNTDSLIVSLQHAGMNVYPVFSVAKRLSFLREINPDGVIYFPHGRLSMGQADAAIEWLRERNIPLFAPLSLLQTQADWEADPMGMSGGFLSQSIVMPELDGSIYPYVVNAQEIDNEGLYLFKAIPERLETFTRIINSFIALKRKNNADKRLAIYYFKGPGQSALAAQGLETVPSLYNLLKRLRTEGYKVENLPGDVREFEKLLMTQGAVLSPYAEGAFDDYLQNGNPALVGKSDYETWVAEELPSALYEDVVGIYGDAPGEYMAVGDSIAVAQVRFGNIVLLPQPMAGLGNDAFAIVHGAKTAPPHTYIASYLWSSHAFHADAILHFGTHGSLEFTPSKQVALSAYDWPDRLVGATPHFYYYTIGNVGESMMAKRRSYATLVSYLTPAFSETDMRGEFKELQNLIRRYRTESDKNISDKIKQLTLKMGLHRDLRIDSLADFTADDIERIENFAEEIANEKMSGELYTSGIAYSPDKIRTTVLAMSADPIAYSIAALDRLNGEVSDNKLKNKVFFTERYLKPAQELVSQILKGKLIGSEHICTIARIKPQDLDEARQILTPPRRSMPVGGAQAAHQQYTPEQRRRARAIAEIERTVNNVTVYKKALEESPEQEFQSLLNALGGGYTAPSSGGDAVANPAAVPTGRNLYSINAEATPSESAWEKGVALVNATLEQYRKQHGDYPRKVSYTFWSSEFIESEGTTVAQVLYMLGVEPVRDAFGRVSDLQLIPAADLQRPRIDVVVQTSGQFRDLAASRLTLINRAVEMAAAASDNDNRVAASATETERLLVEQGIPPLQARELSTQRIFGGINGMYGTGIQGMVTGSDRWDSEKEIADVYINNMGAVYGSDKTWGAFHDGLLRAALHNTDVVVQPRQSNTWGALSLDHVYEFMGGLNLAVRSVTGKDPDAFFADYRNRNNARIQELKEAIGVEARSTIFNPAYIREVMKGNAASAERITEVVTNTFGWNVMKPNVIDREIWDKIYEVYIKDDYGLGVEAFFRRENPFALQEITAVMLETARKGMWQASEQQLADLARLHSALVKDYGSAASGFSGVNAKLHDFIAQKLDNTSASDYRRQLQKMQTAAPSPDSKSGVVMKKETLNTPPDREKNTLNGAIVVTVVLCVFVILLLILRKKRKA